MNNTGYIKSSLDLLNYIGKYHSDGINSSRVILERILIDIIRPSIQEEILSSDIPTLIFHDVRVVGFFLHESTWMKSTIAGVYIGVNWKGRYVNQGWERDYEGSRSIEMSTFLSYCRDIRLTSLIE